MSDRRGEKARPHRIRGDVDVIVITRGMNRRLTRSQGKLRAGGDEAVELRSQIYAPPRNNRRKRPVLLHLGGSNEVLDALRLEVAVRLYGYDGACVTLDALLNAFGTATCCARLSKLAERCRNLNVLLVIITRRPAASVKPLLAGLQRGVLGRKRKTTSTRAISIPSGGVGRRPTSTSWSAISTSLPSPSMKK